jgi:hypothetical protein
VETGVFFCRTRLEDAHESAGEQWSDVAQQLRSERRTRSDSERRACTPDNSHYGKQAIVPLHPGSSTAAQRLRIKSLCTVPCMMWMMCSSRTHAAPKPKPSAQAKHPSTSLSTLEHA